MTGNNYTLNGISLTASDTLTIETAGIYALSCALNFVIGTPPGSAFGVSIAGDPIVAPSSNANGPGQITILRVGSYAAGDTVRIINTAVNAVTLRSNPMVLGSAGHLMLFRFADGGVE